MWAFFAILLIVFLLWPFIRFLMGVHRAKKQFEQAFGQHDSSHRRGNTAQNSTTRGHKIFGKDEGEYVEFEEIQEEYITGNQSGGHKTGHINEPEPQISDAEYEEIN